MPSRNRFSRSSLFCRDESSPQRKRNSRAPRRVLAAISAIVLLSGLGSESSAQIVINEILRNPTKVTKSAGEWFELFNPTAVDIDINGWTIQDNGTDHHVISNGFPLIVPAGGFLVLGRSSGATNGGSAVSR